MSKSFDMEKSMRKIQKEMKRFKSTNRKMTKQFNEVLQTMKPNDDVTLNDMKKQIAKMRRQMLRFKKHNQEQKLKIDKIIADVPEEVKQYDFKVVIFQRISEDDANERRDSVYSRNVINHEGEYYTARKSMSVTTRISIKSFVNRKVSDKDIIWRSLINTLTTDTVFAEYYENFVAYINLIIVKNYTETVIDVDNKHNPIDDFLNADNDNKRICNQFIEYDINVQAEKFGDLFNVKLINYVESNFKANSCFVTAIVNHFKPSFDELRDGVRRHSSLTYESLCDLLQIEDKRQDIGLSINQSKKFFERYRFSLTVVNVFGQVLFHYRPDKLNQNHKTTCMRIVVHNNHCYPIVNNIKKFDVYVKNRVDNLEWSDVDVYVSDKYLFVSVKKMMLTYTTLMNWMMLQR